MNLPDLKVGQRFLGRYEVLRVLDADMPSWLVMDPEAGARRVLRRVEEGLTEEVSLASRAALGPNVLGVHAFEEHRWVHEDEEHVLPLAVVDHYPQSIELSTLAGTWRGVLAKVFIQIAEGLDALHRAQRSLGVLTPRSVRVVSAKGGFVPLLDDLDRWQPTPEDLRGPWVTGEAAFAAPELLVPNAKLSPAGDIFSFGVLMAHAYTGCLPFGDGGAVALSSGGPSVLARRPRTLKGVVLDSRSFAPGLCEVIRSCLALEPLQRPDASELRSALEELALAERSVAHAGVPQQEDIPETPRPTRGPPAEFRFDMSALMGGGPAAPSHDEAESAAEQGEHGAPADHRLAQAVTSGDEVPSLAAPSGATSSGLTRGEGAQGPTGDNASRPAVKGPLPKMALALLALIGGVALAVWWLAPPSSGPGVASGERSTQVALKRGMSAGLQPGTASEDPAQGEAAGEEPLSPAEVEPRLLEVEADPPKPTPYKIAERSIHAALPALGCVGEARVHVAGPPLVIDLPCHMRCILSLDEGGAPERIVRCRGAEVAMTGEGPSLTCTGGRPGGALRCTAQMTLLLGEDQKRIVDTLTLRVGGTSREGESAESP